MFKCQKFCRSLIIALAAAKLLAYYQKSKGRENDSLFEVLKQAGIFMVWAFVVMASPVVSLTFTVEYKSSRSEIR